MARKVILLMGLPGSGKTTWAVEQKHCRRIDSDHIMRRGNYTQGAKLLRGDQLLTAIANFVILEFHRSGEDSVIIIDGLFTNNEVADKMLTAVQSQSQAEGRDIEFTIHYWNLDRATCMYNDNNRRPISARATIKQLPYEVPSAELMGKFGIPPERCIPHIVQRKSEYTAWKHAMEYREPNGSCRNFISSDLWYTGGSYHDGYGKVSDVEPDEPLKPEKFLEFVELVDQAGANEYFEELWEASVETVEGTDSDYYGGIQYKNHYRCDLKQFYEKLKELGLVKTKENISPHKVV